MADLEGTASQFAGDTAMGPVQPMSPTDLLGTGAVASLLPRSVGLQKAKGMLMLGSEVSAVDAERWGLIWAVAEDEQLIAQARRLARRLAASDRSILGAMKTLLHRETIGDITDALQREAQVHDKLTGRPPLQC